MIAKLATKDIMHEWLLSLCLVLAIASIIAPLLLLFGLKYGTIQTLRSRLVQDPKNREIRPLASSSFSNDWFEKVREFDGISFIVPMTRQISSTVEASYGLENKNRLSLLATADGDLLILENGAEVPDENSCVLSQNAASQLKVTVGDEITLTVRRISHGKNETGDFNLLVTGILDARATSLNSIFVQLPVLESVEDFKDGRAVPRYGWPGIMPVAYPVYDGAVVLTALPLNKLEEAMLVNNTGFTKVHSISPEEVHSMTGYKKQDKWSAYLVSVLQRAAEEESIDAVRHRLRGKNTVVLPWVKSIPAELVTTNSDELIAINLSAIDHEILKDNKSYRQLGILPDGIPNNISRFLIVPSSVSLPEGPALLKIVEHHNTLQVPVSILHGIQKNGVSYTPAYLAGMLNLLKYRTVRYNEETDSLLLSRRGYAGFRMYAETIDEVGSVQQRLEEEGITVNTEGARIEEVRRLDSYLSLIFWLIAVVGVVGGISALTASLYASVERKKKELNVLRLLGFLKLEIIRFPVYQGLWLAGSGLVLATSFFIIVSMLINALFRSHLRSTESLCTLSPIHFFVLTCGVFILSVFAAGFASIRATKMDPAEALRDE